MKSLIEYIQAHVERGACPNPESKQPERHEDDLMFFKVHVIGDPNVDELKEAIKAHKGDWVEVNLFDGGEHNYIEIGAWLGDQGLALMLMGMGSLMGLWSLLTPRSIFGSMLTHDVMMRMAGSGMVAIQFPGVVSGLATDEESQTLPSPAEAFKKD